MKEIVKLLNDNGYEAYIVGGYVRDYLLGLTSTDIDICTNAPIDEIIRIFNGRGKAFKEYSAYHIEEDGFTFDITTYRKELRYRRNKPVEIKTIDSFEEDLKRRDFTINTFAIDNKGLLVDLLDARKDLNAKVLKVVGNTEKKLTEDKTRIIRAIRFACTLDFDLDKEILEFIANKKSYLLNEVPKEYKRSELDKIFDTNNIAKFFYIIKRYDMTKYFNISFEGNIIDTYNRYGIWAQIETDLPFTKDEQKIIKNIKKIVNNKDIHISDISLYSDDVVYNAASILHLEDKVRALEEILKLHSIIEIEADADLFLKYVKIVNLKKAYRLVEKSIMEGTLENSEIEIERFLRNLKL